MSLLAYMPICEQCHQKFIIYPEDKDFYQKINVPEPKECPRCRMMLRLTFRNARTLYKRKCDFSGKEIISQYHPDQPFPVYDSEIWYSDKWDAMKYGFDFNFNQNFFSQIEKLKNKVPHMSVFIVGGTLDNSDFTNCTGYLKDCYLIAEADYNEQCYYSNRIYHSKNCLDCSIIYKSELCYECIDCYSCYNVKYSQDTRNCTDCLFLKDCRSCQNCVGCMNLRYGKFMIFNQQYSEEEYRKKLQSIDLDTLRKKSEEFFESKAKKCLQIEHNENCVGNYLYNSKNSFQCFDSDDLENCRYCERLFQKTSSCLDYNSWGDKSELVYFCSSCGNNVYNLKFCVHCLTNCSNLEYCIMCNACTDCFGCVGLNKKKFCIFNKQYTEDEYNKLKEKIIDLMRKGNEYGQFFPKTFSDFGYNETIAMDYFPISKKEASKLGFTWYEKKKNIINSLLLICVNCGKNYRVIPQEKKFYHEQDIPLPNKCPDCRHNLRQQKRAQPIILEKECFQCHKKTLTAYAKEKILCEDCFNKMIY